MMVTVATFDVVLHRSLNALKKALTKSMGDASGDLEMKGLREQKEQLR